MAGLSLVLAGLVFAGIPAAAQPPPPPFPPGPPGLGPPVRLAFQRAPEQFAGRVAYVEGDQLTMELAGSREKLSRLIAPGARIVLNSRPASLQDLQMGDFVRITLNPDEPDLAMDVVAAREVVDTPPRVVRPEPYVVERPDFGRDPDQPDYLDRRELERRRVNGFAPGPGVGPGVGPGIGVGPGVSGAPGAHESAGLGVILEPGQPDEIIDPDQFAPLEDEFRPEHPDDPARFDPQRPFAPGQQREPQLPQPPPRQQPQIPQQPPQQQPQIPQRPEQQPELQQPGAADPAPFDGASSRRPSSVQVARTRQILRQQADQPDQPATEPREQQAPAPQPQPDGFPEDRRTPQDGRFDQRDNGVTADPQRTPEAAVDARPQEDPRRPDGGPETQAPRVVDVIPNSPAELAGIRQGDFIVAWNQRRVSSPQQLLSLIRSQQPGQTVSLHIQRNGEGFQAQVTLTTQSAAPDQVRFDDQQDFQQDFPQDFPQEAPGQPAFPQSGMNGMPGMRSPANGTIRNGAPGHPERLQALEQRLDRIEQMLEQLAAGRQAAQPGAGTQPQQQAQPGQQVPPGQQPEQPAPPRAEPAPR